MATQIFSAAITGFDCELVTVETDILNGMPSFTIVGLPDTAVRESRERIRSAIKNSAADYPRQKKVVNLAPANLRKEGPLFDFPIALGLLAMSHQIPSEALQDAICIGELSLEGKLRPVDGVILIAGFAKEKGFKKIFLPEENAEEASFIEGIDIYPVSSLAQMINWCQGKIILPPSVRNGRGEGFGYASDELDMEDICGQEHAKRALLIAAAGGHNVLLSGPPGSGKTLLAKTFRGILPPFSMEEALEVTKIYSLASLLSRDQPLISDRPFRRIHHSISSIALVGGGQIPKPGEISLAHRGVLFLDELPEFQTSALEALRQPLEDGSIAVQRASGRAIFPAQFTLVASMNPCPCGFKNDPAKPCVCSAQDLRRYQRKLSGPLLDRIDLFVEVPRLPYEKLSAKASGVTSEYLRKKVGDAFCIQKKRFRNSKIRRNGEMGPKEVKHHCALKEKEGALLGKAVSEFHLSPRVFHRLLKVARTIADLEGKKSIESHHIAEALQYRLKLSDKMSDKY